MFINELAEANLVVIYPGRFQPFHRGHHSVYEWLTGKFGRNNVYIATSNKVEAGRSPFSFMEKTYFMQLTGVPVDRIIQAQQPYQIENIIKNGLQIPNPANTVVIFAVSQKDMDEDPRFSFATKKDGSAPYFQPLKNIKNTESMEKHAYIITVPTFEFSVAGQPMTSATELRQRYADSSKLQRQQIIKDLFGRYSREAEQIMNSKIAMPVKEEAAGVGVVRGGKDPRYMTATMGDQNDVDSKTLGKMMKAYSLVGTKAPSARLEPVKQNIGKGVRETREPYQQAIDQLEIAQIEKINDEIDRILQRFATEKLPDNYKEQLKKQVEQLKSTRLNLLLGRQNDQ